MVRYITSRLFSSILTLIAITVVVFFMLQLVPGDPAEVFLGDAHSTPELLERVRAEMGLDKPLYVQYFTYMGNLLQGDLGVSLNKRLPVVDLLKTTLPYSVQLAAAAMLVCTIIGILLGVISALFHNTIIDTLTMVIALIGVSMPVFWLALLCILLFSVRLNWLPSMGQGSFRHLIMPAVILGLLNSATIARLVRSSMLEVLNEDYIRTAYAKGAIKANVIVKHTLRNALIPAVTMLGIQFGQLIGGAVVTETVFSRIGVGRLYVESILTKDIVMIQGITLIIAAGYVFINILVDISYCYLDPRIRYD